MDTTWPPTSGVGLVDEAAEGVLLLRDFVGQGPDSRFPPRPGGRQRDDELRGGSLLIRPTERGHLREIAPLARDPSPGAVEMWGGNVAIVVMLGNVKPKFHPSEQI